MGYDMRFRRTPDGEKERVAEASKAFYAACDERDALPKDEFGHYRPGIDSDGARWGEVPYANASERCKAAQNKVHDLFDKMREVERSYFRLNIGGMSVVRQAMITLGMVYNGAADYDWPDYPESPATQQMIEDLDYPEYAAERKPGEIVLEGAEAEARAYIAARDAILIDHPLGGDSIPIGKFGSNDGWIVTPDECRAALAAWHGASPEARRAALDSAGIAGEDWQRIWAKWIDYLTLAIEYGGFEVH